MITNGRYANLYTDVSETLFAGERYVHVLKDLPEDPRLRTKVLYGSDFYVVDDVEVAGPRGVSLLKCVLGSKLFRTIAVENPDRYPGSAQA